MNAPTAKVEAEVKAHDKPAAPESMTRDQLNTEIKALRADVDNDTASEKDIERLFKLESARMKISNMRKTEIATLVKKIGELGNVKVKELFSSKPLSEVIGEYDRAELMTTIKAMGISSGTTTRTKASNGTAKPPAYTGELPSESSEVLIHVPKALAGKNAVDFEYKKGRVYEMVSRKGQQDETKIAAAKANKDAPFQTPYTLVLFPHPLMTLAENEAKSAKPDFEKALLGKATDAGKTYFAGAGKNELEHLAKYVELNWKAAKEAKQEAKDKAAAKAAAAA